MQAGCKLHSHFPIGQCSVADSNSSCHTRGRGTSSTPRPNGDCSPRKSPPRRSAPASGFSGRGAVGLTRPSSGPARISPFEWRQASSSTVRSIVLPPGFQPLQFGDGLGDGYGPDRLGVRLVRWQAPVLFQSGPEIGLSSFMQARVGNKEIPEVVQRNRGRPGPSSSQSSAFSEGFCACAASSGSYCGA
jgi:hypothetical protein